MGWAPTLQSTEGLAPRPEAAQAHTEPHSPVAVMLRKCSL